MAWLLGALVVVAIVAFAAYRFVASGAARDAEEITALGLDPVYAELHERYGRREIDFETMLHLRKVELRAAQIRQEIAETTLGPGQAMVLEPRDAVDRDALALLAERGTVQPGRGELYVPMPGAARRSPRRPG